MARTDSKLPRLLAYCETVDQQLAWIVARLQSGGCIDETSMWLSGIDLPVRLIGQVKAMLRRDRGLTGRVLTPFMRLMRDCDDVEHHVLAWKLP
jgi:hypothetical protein